MGLSTFHRVSTDFSAEPLDIVGLSPRIQQNSCVTVKLRYRGRPAGKPDVAKPGRTGGSKTGLEVFKLVSEPMKGWPSCTRITFRLYHGPHQSQGNLTGVEAGTKIGPAVGAQPYSGPLGSPNNARCRANAGWPYTPCIVSLRAETPQAKEVPDEKVRSTTPDLPGPAEGAPESTQGAAEEGGPDLRW